MTVREFVKKYKVNVKNCCVENSDGSIPGGFIYSSDAEYKKLFDKTYGDMEVANAYDNEYGDCIIVV